MIADTSLRTAVTFALEAQGVGVLQEPARLAGGTDMGLDSDDDSGCLIIDVTPDDPASIARLEQLRRHQRHGPVIVLASCPSRRLHEAIAAAGATLVEKPLLTDALCMTIERLTDTTRTS